MTEGGGNRGAIGLDEDNTDGVPNADAPPTGRFGAADGPAPPGAIRAADGPESGAKDVGGCDIGDEETPMPPNGAAAT